MEHETKVNLSDFSTQSSHSYYLLVQMLKSVKTQQSDQHFKIFWLLQTRMLSPPIAHYILPIVQCQLKVSNCNSLREGVKKKKKVVTLLQPDLELFVDNSIGNNIFAHFQQKSQYFYCYCYWLQFLFLSFTFWYCFGIVNPQNYKYWAVLS